MTVEFNNRVLTKNRIVGSFIMAIGIIAVSLVSNLFIIAFGEIVARVLPVAISGPLGIEKNLLISNFEGMFAGGIVGLLGFFLLFGRKGSSFSINTHETRRETE